MRVGVLGTGVVGETLAHGLERLGHDVVVGSRTAPPATFADAARHGELVINCTSGVHSIAAMRLATEGVLGDDVLGDKVLIDVANPLDFSGGFPPTLAVGSNDSLAEQIQREFPRLRVVKALNTVTASVMTDPGRLAEPTDVFIAGDDSGAKSVVTELLVELGWMRSRVRDLGGLAAARVTEQYLLLWLSMMGTLGSPEFNLRVVTTDTSP